MKNKELKTPFVLCPRFNKEEKDKILAASSNEYLRPTAFIKRLVLREINKDCNKSI